MLTLLGLKHVLKELNATFHIQAALFQYFPVMNLQQLFSTLFLHVFAYRHGTRRTHTQGQLQFL